MTTRSKSHVGHESCCSLSWNRHHNYLAFFAFTILASVSVATSEPWYSNSESLLARFDPSFAEKSIGRGVVIIVAATEVDVLGWLLSATMFLIQIEIIVMKVIISPLSLLLLCFSVY